MDIFHNLNSFCPSQDYQMSLQRRGVIHALERGRNRMTDSWLKAFPGLQILHCTSKQCRTDLLPVTRAAELHHAHTLRLTGISKIQHHDLGTVTVVYFSWCHWRCIYRAILQQMSHKLEEKRE